MTTIRIHLNEADTARYQALAKRAGLNESTGFKAALDAWERSLAPVTPSYRRSQEEAIAACNSQGLDPYQRVLDGRERWELYQEPLEHYMK